MEPHRDVADDDGLIELETSVLDGLDVADDDDAPDGTLPLTAARRRRALDDVADLLGRG